MKRIWQIKRRLFSYCANRELGMSILKSRGNFSIYPPPNAYIEGIWEFKTYLTRKASDPDITEKQLELLTNIIDNFESNIGWFLNL